MAPPNPATITPAELQARLAAGEDLLLLDVREPTEWAICRLEGSRLVPLGEISTRFSSCVVAGCTVPIRDCEIHHDVAWDVGGETDVKAGVPLCRRKHHPQVSEGGYRLERAAEGGFDLVAPPGAEFQPDRWRSRRSRRGP